MLVKNPTYHADHNWVKYDWIGFNSGLQERNDNEKHIFWSDKREQNVFYWFEHEIMNIFEIKKFLQAFHVKMVACISLNNFKPNELNVFFSIWKFKVFSRL